VSGGRVQLGRRSSGWFSTWAAAAIVLAAACGGEGGSGDGAGPARSRRVVVFTPHGQEMLDEYEAAFEAAYPDIDVVGRFIPTGQILSQLRIDRASPKVDVWWGGTTAFFTQAKQEGLLEPYRPSWAEAVEPDFRDVDDAWYAQFIQAPAIIYNVHIYDPRDVPQTWEELLDPKWAGKIVIREPLHSGTVKTIFTGLIWAMGGPDRDTGPGYAFLKRLDAQTRAYLPDPQALYDRVARSPAGYISLWNVTDAIFQREANGYPFGFVIPRGPAPISLDPIAIVARGPNPAEARLFYEFVTSKEAGLRMARDHFRLLARRDIPPEAVPEILAAVKFEPLHVDLAEFDRLQVEWMRHWQDHIRSPEK